jgi:hypothetical protein
MKTLNELKVGDTVTRWLAGSIPMTLPVTAVTETTIECADWTFDRATGAEIDEYLDWGPPPKMTGSYIVAED